MAQKLTWPRQKVTLKITQAQADLILANDCIDQKVLDSLDFSEPHAGIVAYGQKTHSSQFPDQRYRVNGHHRQPRAKQLNPAWAAAAPGLHDPSALA